MMQIMKGPISYTGTFISKLAYLDASSSYVLMLNRLDMMTIK